MIMLRRFRPNEAQLSPFTEKETEGQRLSNKVRHTCSPHLQTCSASHVIPSPKVVIIPFLINPYHKRGPQTLETQRKQGPNYQVPSASEARQGTLWHMQQHDSFLLGKLCSLHETQVLN